TPLSDITSLRSGYFNGSPDHSQSMVDVIALIMKFVTCSPVGASVATTELHPDEAPCKQTTVSVSAHASTNGSQCPLWSEGRPTGTGFSTIVTALKPRSALRRISAAPSIGSLSHGSWQGMKRSGWRPTHSSRK